MATKESRIDVKFIDNDESQISEESSPSFLLRQDGEMQHIGIRKDLFGSARE